MFFHIQTAHENDNNCIGDHICRQKCKCKHLLHAAHLTVDDLACIVCHIFNDFQSLRIAGNAGIAVACKGKKTVQHTDTESAKTYHNGAINRHCKSIASETIFRFQVIQYIRKKCHRHIHCRNTSDSFQHHTCSNHSEAVYIQEADKATYNRKTKSCNNGSLFAQLTGNWPCHYHTNRSRDSTNQTKC